MAYPRDAANCSAVADLRVVRRFRVSVTKPAVILVLVAAFVVAVGVFASVHRPSDRFPTLAGLRPDSHTWTLSQNVNPASGGFILRLNQTAKDLRGHPALPFQFYLTIPIVAPKPDGLPTPEEHDGLAVVETAATTLLESANESILVAVVTTEAKKDMIFYSSNTQGVEAKIARLRQDHPSHTFQLEIQRDPNWKVFNDLLRINGA
jgi:hypothetical protein